jgi:molybdopterin-guanine dinucleotide biosynthesis protein A
MKLRSSSSVEICILAGGLSRRLGRDKSRLRLGHRTLLDHIRAEAKKLVLPVRVIRRDAVPRCGPLGGVYTALKTARADAVMFLACDMPFITAPLLHAMHRRFGDGSKDLFVCSEGQVGFPFLIRHDALATVTDQIEQERFSLHELARVLKAKTLRAPPGWRPQLRNINTPEEWRRAIRLWDKRRDA